MLRSLIRIGPLADGRTDKSNASGRGHNNTKQAHRQGLVYISKEFVTYLYYVTVTSRYNTRSTLVLNHVASRYLAADLGYTPGPAG